ncbi:MAG: class I SAM-dependent methyltransferase [Siculibacillus sp.]|nr:class I SAM-dependent methyltransferase [Siculibacillus sp.]
MAATDDWLQYWNGDVSLYVGPRHLEAHYEGLFRAVRPLLPPAPFTVLDYGCGEALMAPRFAAAGASVLLHDAAAARADVLRRRFRDHGAITVVDDLATVSATCDLALLISVLQYIPRADLPAILGRLRTCLKPGGRLVIGDILAPDNGVVADVAALLRFGWREGFLLAAIGGLARTLRSDYGRLRNSLGLTTWTLDDLAGVLDAAGFTAEPLGWNIGHAEHRRSLVATAR